MAYTNTTAIIVSCVASLRQLLVTFQNQTESGGATYPTPYAPMLQKSKSTYPHPVSGTLEDLGSALQSSTSDQMMMSPMNTVHVRHDWNVTTKAAERGERAPRYETSFD